MRDAAAAAAAHRHCGTAREKHEKREERRRRAAKNTGTRAARAPHASRGCSHTTANIERREGKYVRQETRRGLHTSRGEPLSLYSTTAFFLISPERGSGCARETGSKDLDIIE